MPFRLPHKGLIRTLALVVSVCALALALVGASQSLAQTRGKAACTTTGAHTRTKRHTATCTTRKPRRAIKRDDRRVHAKRGAKGKSHSGGIQVAARCADGSAPTPTGEGSFACADGSEPECENGATPTPADDGQRLVCPALDEQSAGEADCEALEEQEQEGACGGEAGAQECEAADTSCEGQS